MRINRNLPKINKKIALFQSTCFFQLLGMNIVDDHILSLRNAMILVAAKEPSVDPPRLMTPKESMNHSFTITYLKYPCRNVSESKLLLFKSGIYKFIQQISRKTFKCLPLLIWLATFVEKWLILPWIIKEFHSSKNIKLCSDVSNCQMP